MLCLVRVYFYPFCWVLSGLIYSINLHLSVLDIFLDYSVGDFLLPLDAGPLRVVLSYLLFSCDSSCCSFRRFSHFSTPSSILIPAIMVLISKRSFLFSQVSYKTCHPDSISWMQYPLICQYQHLFKIFHLFA